MKNLSFLTQLVSGPGAKTPLPPHLNPPDDREALDAYSESLIQAVEKAGPAVVHVSSKDGQGEGSGFLTTPDGFLVTNCGIDDLHRLLSKEKAGNRFPLRIVRNDHEHEIQIEPRGNR